jgi:hypothetical protein
MKYETLGTDTSTVEVTNVSAHGFWLLLGEQELFLPFETFPWFRNASVGSLVHVELPAPGHLYWPELDIDLEVESILHPEKYPLVSQMHEAGEIYGDDLFDVEKVEDVVLALLQLTLHEGRRAWKGFDFEVLDRLQAKGWIEDPKNKSKSLVLTPSGEARSRSLFDQLFGKRKSE